LHSASLHKLRKFGCTLISICICQNSSSAFHPCLHFARPNTITLRLTMFWDGILLNAQQASWMLAHFSYMDFNQVIPHINIKLSTNLDDLLINMHVLLKCNYTCTRTQRNP
jgi:hypothetical protein